MRVIAFVSQMCLCFSFVQQSFIRRSAIFVQLEDFSAGTIREARPFRVGEKNAEGKKISENASFLKPPPPLDVQPMEPKPIAPLQSEIEAARKRKHAEALKKELEAMEKRIVQRKEDAWREARQKRAILLQEEAALAEAEKKRAAAEAEVKRLVAEKSDTVKNEEAAQRAEAASLQADAEEEVAASRAQKAEEEAYEAQRRSEKAQQEVEEFRRKAKKDLDEARRQAQEYADKAKLEREQTVAKIIQPEAETELEAAKLENGNVDVVTKSEAVLAGKEQGNPLVASKENLIEQTELVNSSDPVEETLSLAIEKLDQSDPPLLPLGIIESTEPFTSPISASTVRIATSDVGVAALPFAAFVGGTIAFRNHRIKQQLERHVTLRELSKERIEELAEEDSNRMQFFFWASITTAFGMATLQL
ncbi:hypothetical protein FisN_16Hu190 [Fistulifera solaris]|uniref:Uncharacterized protein n=1 Tax=Fistulifera solaris TaxID=1519565 RepID=A0A1Z5KTN1_FISSO|nr:hypothetical protein FisN_16Hu190 [Fistulifera solaris]|eukprot:GAX29371.1 hypothetical protein FisN_16Hu190 [Fistulifera solaris]